MSSPANAWCVPLALALALPTGLPASSAWIRVSGRGASPAASAQGSSSGSPCARALSSSAAFEHAADEAYATRDHEAARAAIAKAVEVLRDLEAGERGSACIERLDDLGRKAYERSDAGTAHRAWTIVLETREKTLLDDHLDLQQVRGNLALVLKLEGDLQRAHALEVKVLSVRERTLPEDHPDLQIARANLAGTLRDLGDLLGARRLQELALAVLEETHPSDHPDLQRVRGGLATTLNRLGDLQGACAIEQQVLAALEASLPDDDFMLQTARGNLAGTLGVLGDLEGARLLQEKVLAVRERTLPEDHPDLLTTRANLAAALYAQGNLAGARALQEKVLAARERTLPGDHPDLQIDRGNLAATLRDQGDLAGARSLQEKVLAVREKTLAEEHPHLQIARGHLGATLRELGDLPGARALQEKVLATWEKTLPEGHPHLQVARVRLAWTLAGLGESERLSTVLRSLIRATRSCIASTETLAPRESRARLEALAADVSTLASLAGTSADPDELADRFGLFALVETLRVRATECPLAGERAGDEATARRRARAQELRSRINDLVAAGSSGRERRGDGRSSAAELASLVRERDQVEGDLRSRLVELGLRAQPVEAKALAKALPEGSCAVGYRRYSRMSLDPEARHRVRGEDRMLAHVLHRDGRLVRVELGPADGIVAAVERWRGSIGKPLERGSAPKEARDESEQSGEELRALVLDPVLAAAGEARRLFVCLDDALFLAALDALPIGPQLENGEEGRSGGAGARADPLEAPAGVDGAGRTLVGERCEIRCESSFARLLSPLAAPEGAPTFVAVGGVDFNARLEEGHAPAGRTDGVGPTGTHWGLLPETRAEAAGIAALFEDAFEVEPVVLTGKDATKKALYARSQGARFLHVATHGYFAPQSVRSIADPRPPDALWERSSLEDAVRGLAPMSLCGLALAGANCGADSRGKVPGVLTAEELAGLDLTGCELAVLSACETSVGITRAGQGIQSLQAALHAAGARTAVTSLWKVDDARTRELFEDFYTRIWVRREPKAPALWNAKMALRRKGYPARDWAGWVLTGDPR